LNQVIIGQIDRILYQDESQFFVAILIKAYSGFTPTEILSTPPDFLKEIGMIDLL
jgi:hypothetical protein